MDINNRNLIEQIEELKKENKELTQHRDAYIKKSEYLSRELEKANKGRSGHMSGLEIASDLALTLCIALLITITTYISGVYGEGFFEMIKNAFSYIF